MKNSRAFTLIELLVVVLIIGILAAVALPQYKLAVTKTHVAAILPTLKAIAQANQTYYLSNGTYQYNVNQLDVSMSGECQPTPDDPGNRGQTWKCGKNFVIDNSRGKDVIASYCPNANTDYASCYESRQFVIEYRGNNTLRCGVLNESDLGTKICNSLAHSFAP